jgi:hypothetical protein
LQHEHLSEIFFNLLPFFCCLLQLSPLFISNFLLVVGREEEREQEKVLPSHSKLSLDGDAEDSYAAWFMYAWTLVGPKARLIYNFHFTIEKSRIDIYMFYFNAFGRTSCYHQNTYLHMIVVLGI